MPGVVAHLPEGARRPTCSWPRRSRSGCGASTARRASRARGGARSPSSSSASTASRSVVRAVDALVHGRARCCVRRADVGRERQHEVGGGLPALLARARAGPWRRRPSAARPRRPCRCARAWPRAGPTSTACGPCGNSERSIAERLGHGRRRARSPRGSTRGSRARSSRCARDAGAEARPARGQEAALGALGREEREGLARARGRGARAAPRPPPREGSAEWLAGCGRALEAPALDRVRDDQRRLARVRARGVAGAAISCAMSWPPRSAKARHELVVAELLEQRRCCAGRAAGARARISCTSRLNSSIWYS